MKWIKDNVPGIKKIGLLAPNDAVGQSVAGPLADDYRKQPSLGLVPVLVERIGEILREIQAAEGLAVLLAEQSATWALSLANRGVIFDVDRIRMTGDAAELLGNPDVRKAYLGV